MNCPHCGAATVTEAATFRDFDCLSTWTEGLGVEQSDQCRNRQHVQDLAVDDEINRRREHRHFEPDHFGS
jgi:hypothetical protein